MAHILVSEVGERTVILRSGIVGNTPQKRQKNEKRKCHHSSTIHFADKFNNNTKWHI